MKFRAFTLTEVVLTIGIIGVLAVITAPAISDLMPDKNKMIIIKIYEQLKEINEEIISDPGLYFQDNNCEGLACGAEPLRTEGLANLTSMHNSSIQYAGNSKYPAILANRFNKESSAVINEKELNGEYTSIAFIPFQGVECKIYSKIIDINSVPNFFCLLQVTIYGNNIDNYNSACIYGDDCLQPNRYLFTIASDGSILPADPVSKAYLKNPGNILSRKKEKAFLESDPEYTWPDWMASEDLIGHLGL